MKKLLIPVSITAVSILVFLALVLWAEGVGYPYRITIEQEAKMADIITGEYSARTFIWLNKGGKYITIAKSYRATCKCDSIPAVFENQMILALKEKVILDAALKDFKICEYVN